jgi:tetratricopeptide (TPR) repeat protein
MSRRGATANHVGRFDDRTPKPIGRPNFVDATKSWLTATRAIAAVLSLAATVPLCAQEPNGWIGKRVVQTRHELALQADEQSEGRTQNEIHIYRVERIEGRLLWLEAEGGRVAGWAQAANVLPVENAVEFFTKETRAHPDDPFPFLMRATVWHDKKDLARALADYTEAIRLNPRNAALRCNRGHAYREGNEPDKAIADFDEAIRLDPTDVAAFIERGATRASRREFDKAISDFSEAIRLAPDQAAAYIDRGVAWSHKKEHDKAISDFSEAIRLNPADPQPYYNRGHAWSSKKQLDRAVSDYSEAIRLGPNEVDAHINRGILWQSQREFDKALTDFRRAVEIGPLRADAHLALAGGWETVRELDKALASYDHAIGLDLNSSRARFGRAAVLFMLGRPGVAQEVKTVIEHEGWRGELAPYAAILGYFAARRGGENEQAKSLLETAEVEGDQSAWPHAVVKYLRSEIDEPKLLAAASDGEKMTETRCFVGLDQLQKGRNEAALAHFQWVKEHGEPSFVEYSIAVSELERLAARRTSTPPR